MKIRFNKIKLLTTLIGEIVLVTTFPSKIGKETLSYQVGEHNLIETNKNITSLKPKSFKKDLNSPPGYKVVDYDYEKNIAYYIENILYKNTKIIDTESINEFGTPKTQNQNDKNNIYAPHKHQIVEYNVKFELHTKKHQLKVLTAPEGYEITKYNYEKNNEIVSEIILYENTVPVEKDKENDFGKPLVEITKNNDYIEVKDQKLAVININKNLIFKNRKKKLTTPPNYKIIDYDYNRTFDEEVETILYENSQRINKNILEQTFKQNDEEYYVEIEKTSSPKFKKLKYMENPIDYNLISYSTDYNKYYTYNTKLYVKKGH